MSVRSVQPTSCREAQLSWSTPIEAYLEKQPVHTVVRVYPLDQVVSAIQSFAAGDIAALDDTSLESILSVVHYPEHLGLLNVKTVSNWFNMMEPYLKSHLLLDQSFGLLMMQVYGLAAMVGFLDHNGMLASAVEKLSTTEAMTKDSGALTSLSLYTSKLANPSMEEPGRTFANYIRRFTNIPDTSDLDSNPRFMVFLPSIGGFKFKSTQFFLQHIFDSRGRLLEVFDRVPAFGWFLILSLMRLQIWFLLKSGDNNDSALEMLTELQDINYRFYLVANTEPEHKLISSLIGEVSGDMSDYNFVDFVGPIGSADVATLSLTLIRHISPPFPETGLTTLSALWHMFEWMDKTIQDANDTMWYPLILASLFHRVWVELFSGLSDAKLPRHHEILVFSGQLLFHVARRFGIAVQGIMTPAQVISMLYDIDFVSLVGCVLVHSVITLDDQGRERKDVTEFTIALDSFVSAFAKHTKLLKSIFEIRYPDWINISDHIRNLKAGLSTANHVNQRRLEECQTQWTEFGELFGYRENTRLKAVLSCCYARCAGVGAIVCKLARCAGCFEAVYCSLQCQQRDWLLESNPHCEVCGKLHD